MIGVLTRGVGEGNRRGGYMHANIDQHVVDEKIQQFMASRSPLKVLSRTLSDHLHHPKIRKSPIKGVSYEPLDWTKDSH